MGTVTHVAPTFVPIRGARSWTHSVIADLGSTRRVRLPNGCATRASDRRSRVAKARAASPWSEEPMVGVRRERYIAAPWRAARSCSRVAACLRPPNPTAPVGDPCSSPRSPIRLANSASAPAMPSTRHTSSPWRGGTPGSAAAVAPALGSTEASPDALACAVDAMSASSSASALLQRSSVGDSATMLSSSTSASLSRRQTCGARS
jgi:hypothetical protein